MPSSLLTIASSGIVFIINNGISAAGENAGRNTGAVAEMARGEYIGCAEKVGKAVDHRFVLPPRAISKHH